jgi:4-hydroxybenzoate polyprenyltransferase
MYAVKAKSYWQLMRMDRPIGSLLLLWPTLWALLLAAQGIPDTRVLIVFVVGVVLMRSAGCVINDFADRNVDGLVERTKQRVLPAGRVTPREALGLFVLLVIASFLLVLTMNQMTIILSFVGVALAGIYPFMKRFTYFPQLFLGLAFSWAIPMAWAAQANELPHQVWLLFIINLLWTIAYDTEYAMVDRDDDIKAGIKSTAVLFGRFDKMIIGLLQLLTLVLFMGLGAWMQLSSMFFWGLFIAAILFVYQQSLLKLRDRGDSFKAFLNNNYVGMIITIGLFFSLYQD